MGQPRKFPAGFAKGPFPQLRLDAAQPRDAVWAQLLQVLAQRGWLAQAAMPGQEGGA